MKRINTKMAAVALGAALSVTTLLGGVMLNKTAITASAEEVMPAYVSTNYSLYSCEHGTASDFTIVLTSGTYHTFGSTTTISLPNVIYSISDEVSSHAYPAMVRAAIAQLGDVTITVSGLFSNSTATINSDYETGYYRVRVVWQVCSIDMWIQESHGSVASIFESGIDGVPLSIASCEYKAYVDRATNASFSEYVSYELTLFMEQ